jgi:hypothetical protein
MQSPSTKPSYYHRLCLCVYPGGRLTGLPLKVFEATILAVPLVWHGPLPLTSIWRFWPGPPKSKYAPRLMHGEWLVRVGALWVAFLNCI